MQKCLHCGEKFTYKQILRSLIGRLTYSKLICNNCAQNHEISIPSRLIVSVGIGGIPLLPALYLIRFSSSFTGIVYCLISITIVTFMSPFILRFKKSKLVSS